MKIILPDNLGEGVLKPDIYDATLNPLYRDVLAHYGAVAVPCRVGDPDRKGKVESGVGHAQKTPLKGQRFESMEEAQAHLDQWEKRWADTRIHGTTKRQVAEAASVLKSGDHVHIQGQIQTREYVGSKSQEKQRDKQIRVSSVLRVELLTSDEAPQPDDEEKV